MKVAVQIYGRLTEEDQGALSWSLQQEFASLPDAAGEAEPVVPTFLEDIRHGIDESQRPSDVRICILTKEDDRPEKARLFEKLINRNPLVPVVFKNREDVEWEKLSKDVRRALETSWWWIVRPIDLPVMILDRAADHQG